MSSVALPYDSFGPQLVELIAAVTNRLERDHGLPRLTEHPGARPLFLGLARAAGNTYQLLRYALADLPQRAERRPEFALAVSPLNRRLLEVLAAIVFLFNSLGANVDRYYRAGWREAFEELQRLRIRYATDPAWDDWLNSFATFLKDLESSRGITSNERAQPSRIEYWPTPSQMRLQFSEGSERRRYFEYLNDWYYRHLSQDEHLSWTGLIRASALLNPDPEREQERRTAMADQKNAELTVAFALLLAILSELELELRFGYAGRLAYVWKLLADHAEPIHDLYTRFYAHFFSGDKTVA